MYMLAGVPVLDGIDNRNSLACVGYAKTGIAGLPTASCVKDSLIKLKSALVTLGDYRCARFNVGVFAKNFNCHTGSPKSMALHGFVLIRA